MENKTESPKIWPNDYEQASYAYLMAIAGVIIGLPLPIINIIAALIFYAGKRKASYFVRWHSIQALLAQVLLLPFNSVALTWTISIIYNKFLLNGGFNKPKHYYTVTNIPNDAATWAGIYYWLYLAFVIALNIAEFITVISTASKLANGKNVRLFIIAPITDRLCSKNNRDPYQL